MDNEKIVETLTRFEQQIARLQSDADSEKGTRRRSNERIYDEFEKINLKLDGLTQKIIEHEEKIKMRSAAWGSIGGLAVALTVAFVAYIIRK